MIAFEHAALTSDVLTIDATHAPAPIATPKVRGRSLTDVEVAKLIRAELKAAFPATKFSVTSKSSIRVNYTDGPTPDRVEAIVMKFEGKGFDGMTDSTTYRGPFRYKGEWISTNCYVFVSRDVSGAFARRLAVAIASFYGMEAPDVIEGWVKPSLEQERECQRCTCTDWGTMIYRASRNRLSVTPHLQLV
jgi:hypothetical protein